MKSDGKIIKISLTWTPKYFWLWAKHLRLKFNSMFPRTNLLHVPVAFFFSFLTLPLMCILWRDAYLYNWEVPVTDLAASDCGTPFSATVPIFIPGELLSLSSTPQKFIINYCNFNTEFKGLGCYKNSIFFQCRYITLAFSKSHVLVHAMLLNKKLGMVARTELDLIAVCWDNGKLPKRKKKAASHFLWF